MTAPDERLTFDLVARDRASRDFDRVGDAAVRAGRDFDRASDGAGHLQSQIDETTDSIRQLGIEFDKTGNRALLKDIGRERRTLSGLTKLRKEMSGLGDDTGGLAHVAAEAADAVGDISRFTLKGLTSAIESLPQQLKGALIVGAAVAATAAAPAIGALITGAVVGAVGSGAIAAGIASAAKSPEVKAAWDDFATEGKNAFAIFGEPFIEPTVQAIGILQDSLVDIRSDLAAIGQDAARLVEPLAQGVGGFVEAMVPGIRALVRDAGPVFEMLGRELPQFGRAVGEFFEDLGDGAQGGALALQALLRVTEFTLDVLGQALKDFANVVTAAAVISEKFGGGLEFLFKQAPQLEEMGETGEHSFELFAEGAQTAEDRVRDFNQAISDAFDEIMNLDQAAIDFKLGLIGLREELAENGRKFDENSEAGLRNRDVLLEMIDKANRMREAAIAQGDGTREGTTKANAAYDAQIAQIRKVAVAFGLSAAQVDAFIAKYRAAALQPNLVKTITIKVIEKGGRIPTGGMGQLIAMAHGGPVEGPGPKGVDSVPTMLAPGEFVMSASAVDRIGRRTLDALNRDAGIAAAAAGGASAPMTSGGGNVTLDFSGLRGGDELLAQWLHRNISAGRIQLRVSGTRVAVG